MAYDRYAPALYGYSHWILHDSAAAAGALKDTFVIAAATLSNLSEPSTLRPWLFALVRSECRRRVRPTSAARAGRPMRTVSRPMRPMSWPMPVMTCPMRRCSSVRSGRWPMPLMTCPMRRSSSRRSAGAAAADDLSDATVQFRAVGPLADAADDLSDATVQFRAVGRRPAAADDLSDATVQFRAVGPAACCGR